MRIVSALAFAAALAVVSLAAQQTPPLTPDIPGRFDEPTTAYDYVKRTAMIPMRDGVKLYTVLVVPKGARNAPLLLTRTPYNASDRAQRSRSPHVAAALPLFDELFAADGYIRVYQDVRGKYKSEGEYVMTRPLRGPLNTSAVDHSTDAYDTIDWLVKNVPESNGRVGMVGSSYEGFTVVMALVNPHPALKAAVPESPMVDGWMGDDWFHYGAFRQTNLDYFREQTTARGKGDDVVRESYDDYENFRRAGSAGDFAKAAGLDQLPWWRKVAEHPAYDAFWQAQALDAVMAKQPLTVPTIWLQRSVGPGRHVGSDSQLRRRRAKGHGQRQELPDHGAVVSQPDQPRRQLARSAAMERRHDARSASRHPQAVLRSVSEGRGAKGEYAAGSHLQHRGQSLGSFQVVAAVLRHAVRRKTQAPLPVGRVRTVVCRPGVGTVVVRIRRVRVGSRQAGALHATTNTLQGRRGVAPVARQRPARGSRSHRRADVFNARARRAGNDRRSAGRPSRRCDERHRQRLGREADRRLPR
jgi:hypothetical protein